MKYVFTAVLIALIVLSIAAGATKVLNFPQEAQFFANAGLGEFWLFPLGVAQIAGGLLAILRRTRPIALVLMAVGFLASTVVIFMTGNASFGFLSLVPILLSLLVFWHYLISIGRAG